MKPKLIDQKTLLDVLKILGVGMTRQRIWEVKKKKALYRPDYKWKDASIYTAERAKKIAMHRLEIAGIPYDKQYVSDLIEFNSQG